MNRYIKEASEDDAKRMKSVLRSILKGEIYAHIESVSASGMYGGFCSFVPTRAGLSA